MGQTHCSLKKYLFTYTFICSINQVDADSFGKGRYLEILRHSGRETRNVFVDHIKKLESNQSSSSALYYRLPQTEVFEVGA